MEYLGWKEGIRAVCFLLVLGMVLSFCNYALFNDSNHRRVMMHEMYTYEPSIDLAVLGGSVAYVHFDPRIWDETLDMHTFNLGSDTQSPDATYFLLKELFKYHSPKYCVFATTYVGFLKDAIYDNPTKDYILFDYFRPSLNKVAYWAHAFDDETALEAVLPFLREKKQISLSMMSETVRFKQSESYREYSYANHSTGWAEYCGNGFVEVHDGKTKGEVGWLFPQKYTPEAVDPMKIDYFEKIVNLCRKNGCELIMAVTPVPYGTMGTLGNYQEICDFYAELAKKNDVELFDFSLSKPALFKSEDADFYDHVHMNGEAAKRFSLASSEIIRKYIHGETDWEEWFYDCYQELLDASPYIFNTWLEPIRLSDTEVGYVAKSTYGADVVPEYRFSVKRAGIDQWEFIRDYDTEEYLWLEEIPPETVQIRVEARPHGSLTDCQQLNIIDPKLIFP